MNRFLRYFCFYCVSRFAYDSLRRSSVQRKPCDHRLLRGLGFLLVLVFLAPLVIGVVLAVTGGAR